MFRVNLVRCLARDAVLSWCYVFCTEADGDRVYGSGGSSDDAIVVGLAFWWGRAAPVLNLTASDSILIFCLSYFEVALDANMRDHVRMRVISLRQRRLACQYQS